MIKNVIFDIGNVLVDFCWKDFLIDKGFDEAMIKRIVACSIATPYWDEFDKGGMTEEEVFEKFISLDPEIENEIHKAYDNISGIVRRHDDAIAWVEALKKAGYGVYYLSNFSRKAHDECIDTLDFLPHTDGGILSYNELITKPDPEIYKRLLNRFNLTADECVFIDDTEKNIIAARELGIHGIVHKSYEDTVAQLEELGVVYQSKLL